MTVKESIFNKLCCPYYGCNESLLNDCKVCYFGYLYALKLPDDLVSYSICARYQSKMVAAMLVLQIIVIILSTVVLYVVFATPSDDDDYAYYDYRSLLVQLKIQFGLSVFVFGILILLFQILRQLGEIKEMENKYIKVKLVLGIVISFLIAASQILMDINRGMPQIFYVSIWLSSPIFLAFLPPLCRFFVLYYVNIPRFRGDTPLRDTAASLPRAVFQPTIFQPEEYHPPSIKRITEDSIINPIKLPA